jgi:hypothetical protein
MLVEPHLASVDPASGPSPPFASPQEASKQVSLHFTNQVIHSLTNDRLTESSPFYLFGRQREYGEQLHKYLDNHAVHSVRRRDLGIDLEAIEKVSNRLEQISQSIVVIQDAPDRLIRLNVRNTFAREIWALTESRIPRPVCIAFTAAAGYRMKIRDIARQLVPSDVPGEHGDRYGVWRKEERRKLFGE